MPQQPQPEIDWDKVLGPPAKAPGLPTKTPEDYRATATRYAEEAGFDPSLIHTIIERESKWNPRAVSPKNARGLMQLMPGTAARFGVRDVFNPEQNIRGGVAYLKTLREMFGGDTDLMLAAYNAGEGAVKEHGNRIPPYKETQEYVRWIKDRYQPDVDWNLVLGEAPPVEGTGMGAGMARARKGVQWPHPDTIQGAAAAPTAAETPAATETPLYGVSQAAPPPAPSPLKPGEQPVGYFERIRQGGPEFESAYQDWVQKNTPKTTKAKTVGQAAADPAMAWSFLKLADFYQANQEADDQTLLKGFANIGLEFLRSPETAGSQLPKALHDAMLVVQYTPEEWKTIPQKLRQQIRSFRAREAASQGQQKEMEALRPDIETLGPTVEDWLPDLRYHLLMFEGEFQSLPRAKQIEVLRLVASRVRGDQQVRATQGAQAVQQPVLAEINQMRAGLGLGRADQQPATPSRLPVNEPGVAATAGGAQFGAEAGVATGVPREPIAVRPRPFTFNQQSLRDQIRQEVIKERGRIAVPEEGDVLAKRMAPGGGMRPGEYAAGPLEDEVNRRVAEAEKLQAWLDRNQTEIAQISEATKRGLEMSEAGEIGVNRWLGEMTAQGVSGLVEKVGGWARLQGFDYLARKLGDTGPTERARLLATGMARGALESGADRNAVSRWVQGVGAGFISTAPELIGMMLGVPGVAAFGIGGGLGAAGRGEGLRGIAKEAAIGGAIGRVFDWSDLFTKPVIGSGLRQTLKYAAKKVGTVGAGTAAVETLAGAPLSQVAQSALTNALLALPGAFKKKEAGDAKRKGTPVQRERGPTGQPYNAGVAREGPVEGRGEPSGIRPGPEPAEGRPAAPEEVPGPKDVVPPAVLPERPPNAAIIPQEPGAAAPAAVPPPEPAKAAPPAAAPAPTTEKAVAPKGELTSDELAELADAQRGDPEAAMLKVQFAMGGGVLNPVVENVGDLTHRMTERVTQEYAGYGYVRNKVERALRSLKHSYGFVREMNENIASNARVNNKSEAATRAKIDAALKAYADAHRKLPAKNEVQRLARDAAVDLGEQNWSAAIAKLEKLQSYIDEGTESWVKRVRQREVEPPPVEVAKQPRILQRYEEQDAASSFDKPQGLYTTPADVQSPHADLGGARTTYELRPDAKVLNIEPTAADRKFVVMRGMATDAGAGVHVARQLLGDATFNEWKKLTKAELIEKAKSLDPNVDWSRYYDAQEVMEGIGGILARRKGFDAIDVKGETPEFDEVVLLNKNAAKQAEVAPTEPAAAAPAPTPETKPAEREQKVARIKELRPELEKLAAKKDLTQKEAERFRELSMEADSLRYDIAKPLGRTKIPTEAERRSTLSTDTVMAAWQDLVRNKKIFMSIVDAARGVFFDADTAIDRIMQGRDPDVSARELYDAFSATREAMRKQYGDTVTLYRAQGQQRTKPTTNWATTREFAAQFGRNVEKREVPIDDVVAVNVGLNGKYHEVIVGQQPKVSGGRNRLIEPAAAAEKRPFYPDDKLLMRSPFMNADEVVDFRGPLGADKAVVVTPRRTQVTVDMSWLRREGEPPPEWAKTPTAAPAPEPKPEVKPTISPEKGGPTTTQLARKAEEGQQKGAAPPPPRVIPSAPGKVSLRTRISELREQGFSDTEIAQHFKISEETVRQKAPAATPETVPQPWEMTREQLRQEALSRARAPENVTEAVLDRMEKKAQAAKRYFGRANDPNRPAEVRRSAQVLLDEILSRPLEEEPRHAGPVPPSYHHIVDQGWDIYERLKPRYNRWAQEVRRVFKDWDVSAHLRPAWDAIVKTVQQSRIVSTYGRPLTEGGRGIRVAGGKQIRDPRILEEVSVLVNAAVNRAFVEAAKEKRGRSLEVIREITLRILGGKARGVPKSLEEPSFRNFVERTIENAVATRERPSRTARGEPKPPSWIQTAGDIQVLIGRFKRWTKETLLEAPENRYWYPHSAKEVWDLVGRNYNDALKLLQVIATFSPQRDPFQNWNSAIRAYEAWKSGMSREEFLDLARTAKLGMFPNKMVPRAYRILYEDWDWKGRKTNSFYGNMARTIHEMAEREGHQVPALEEGIVTIDMQIARAAGMNSDKVTEQEYLFLQNLINTTTEELNRELRPKVPFRPEEVQALIWAKVRSIPDSLPAVLEGRAERTVIGRTSFREAAKAHEGYISLEATPNVSVRPDLQPIADASWQVRRDYTQEVMEIVRNSQLANQLGLLTSGEMIEGTGIWKSKTNPVWQFLVQMPADAIERGGQLAFETERNIRAFAAVIARALSQEAVGYSKVMPAANRKQSDTVVVDLGRRISDSELKALEQGVFDAANEKITAAASEAAKLRAKADKHQEKGKSDLAARTREQADALERQATEKYGYQVGDVVFISDAAGFYAFHFKPDNKAFHGIMKSAIEKALPAAEGHIEYGRHIGGLFENNANTQREIANRGASIEEARKLLDTQIEAVNQRYLKGLKEGTIGEGVVAEGPQPGRGGPPGEGYTGSVGPPPSYGKGIEHSVPVNAVHYSPKPLTAVETSRYGTGLPGAEARRVRDGEDARLRSRGYFYVETGKGVKREPGLGPETHKVRLENLYDIMADPLGLAKRATTVNDFESAILDAGYDGYLSRPSSAAVLLGEHSVPVKHLGRIEAPAIEKVPEKVVPEPPEPSPTEGIEPSALRRPQPPSPVQASRDYLRNYEAQREGGIRLMHSGADPYYLFHRLVDRGWDLYDQKVRPLQSEWVAALRAEFKEHAEKLDDLLPAVWKQMQAATGERLGPGAAAVTEQFPEVKERRFGKQLMADKELAQELKDELGTSRYYEPIPNKATAEEAQRLVETRSVSENIRAIKDESSTLPYHVRAAVGQVLIKKLNTSYKALKAAGEVIDAEQILSQAVELAEWGMDYGTRLGQGAQSFAMWSRLTAEGKLLSFRRMVKKARGRYDDQSGPEVRAIIDALNDAENAGIAPEVIEKIIRRRIDSARKKAGELGVWQEYKELIARQLKSLIDPKSSGSSPPLQEFSSRLFANVKDLIVQPEKTKPAPDLDARLREVIENFDKYQEAWGEAADAIRKKYGGDSLQELARVEQRIVTLRSAFQTKAFEKVFQDAVKQTSIDFRELARAHWRDRAATRDQLIQSIKDRLSSAGMELTPEDVAALTDAVSQRMAGKLVGVRQSILKSLAKQGNRTAKKVLPYSEQLLRAARTGALNEEVFYNLVSERLGLPKYDPKIAAVILEKAAKVEDAPEGMPRDAAVRELQSYLATQEGFDVADLPVGMYYAHILSGYNTHLVNTIDTALNVVAEVGELAALEPKAASAVYGGLLRGLSEGRFEALAALTRGRLITRERWMDPGKLGEQSTLLRPPMQEPPRPRLFEVARFGEKGGVPLKTETVTGRVLKAAAESKIAYPLRAYKYVPRLLTASDALFYRGAAEARASLLAYRIAEGEGLKGEERARRIQEVLGQGKEADLRAQARREGFAGHDLEMRVTELRRLLRPYELSLDANNWAGEATYNHAPKGVLGYLANHVRSVSARYPFFKLFVPFTDIVANVTNRKLHYTPFFWATFEGKEMTPEQRRLQLTRAVAGTAGLVGLGALQQQGVLQIHGGGPVDREKRRQLEDAGWAPYTLQIGNQHWSYMYTPLALGLGMMGNYLDATRYNEMSHQEAGRRLAYTVMRLPSTVFSQSFLSGLSRLFEALSTEPAVSTRAISQVFASTVGSVTTPNLLRDMYRLYDNKAYQSDSLMEDLIRNTPVAAVALKPKLNAFGEPVEVRRQRFLKIATSDPVWRFVTEHQLRVPAPSRVTEFASGQRMGGDEYHALLLRTGPRLKQWIAQNQRALAAMDKPTAQDELTKAATAITKQELDAMRKAAGLKKTTVTSRRPVVTEPKPVKPKPVPSPLPPTEDETPPTTRRVRRRVWEYGVQPEPTP